MPRIALACLCAAALAVLPACGSSGQEVPGVSAASTGSSFTDSAGQSSSESDTAPPAETSGTESARPPQGKQPSVTVASLPIGVDTDEGCLTIRFERAASEVPAGMRVVVTRIRFKPQVIEFGGSGCSGRTPLCRDGLVLTQGGRDKCFASIRARDADDVGRRVEVLARATVYCAAGQAAACVRYKKSLESDRQKEGVATVSVPEPPEAETSPTTEPPSPSTSDSD